MDQEIFNLDPSHSPISSHPKLKTGERGGQLVLQTTMRARDLMLHPESVSAERHTVPEGAELNEEGMGVVSQPTHFARWYMTHHAVVKVTSQPGLVNVLSQKGTPFDPEDVCVVGVHLKENSHWGTFSEREWRTSPVLIFFENKWRQKFAYTCSGSLYSLGKQVELSELIEMVPKLTEFLK